ncbi:MAG TPA: ATP-binding cassette domain-containing protein [Polyangiaceae bacterium]|nr:ATP-binding cassette domain-containing protein [Polyangiaceae bacterium]
MSGGDLADRRDADAIVDVRDLTIGYGGSILLRDASFDVRRGEIFAILGRSGSGKSTLLRHLVGLERPIAGTIAVLGVAPIAPRDGPPPYGVTFQSGALLGSMTVGENVALPLERWTALGHDLVDVLVRAKLRVVGLAASATKMPSELSGGMTTRAAIARAMALEPPLVFLDEPTAGLDPVTALELDELLLALNRTLGLTVVLVTHELRSIYRIATRCLMIDRSTRSVIAVGDPRVLREASSDARVRAFLGRPEPERGSS